MEILFFNCDGNFKDVANKIYDSIGIENYGEGDSANVLDGIYYKAVVFGVAIKLEKNSYDYEDEFKYMLSIRNNLVRKLIVADTIVDAVTSIVEKMLYDNAKINCKREH